MLGFWKLKVTVGIGNIRNWLIWHVYPIQPANPVWAFLLSESPSSIMRFLTHREDQYDVAASSWVSIRFLSQVFRFYSRDVASGRYYMSSQIFPFLCTGAHALGFLARFVA
jgi:hypothetical protein